MDYAAKNSGLDLTDRVIRGSIVDPPYQPCASVMFSQALESYGPTLGRFQFVAEFEVYCFVGGSTLSDRFDNAANLSSDIIEALTTNRRLGLGNKVDDVLCSFTAIDGAKYGLDQFGIGYIKVDVQCVSDTGA